MTAKKLFLSRCVCIRCDTELKDMGKEGVYLQPGDGLAFVTYGHYGSAFFDPCDGTGIEIVVCDDCLRDWFKTKSLGD